MALDFPNTPALNATYSSAGVTWIWDGAKWESANAASAYVQIAGSTMTGPLVLSGPATASLNPVSLAQLNTTVGGYLPLTGGTLSAPGSLTVSGVLTVNGAGTALSVPNSGTIGTLTVPNTAIINQLIASAASGDAISVPNGGRVNIAGPLVVGGGAVLDNVSFSTNGISFNSGFHFLMFNWNAANSNIDFYMDGPWIGSIAVSISDPRLKTNRQPVAIDALGIVNAIALEQFDLTPPFEGAVSCHWPIGLMADQLTTIMPQAVTRPTADGYDSVNPLMLICSLIGAVQQLTRRVAELEG